MKDKPEHIRFDHDIGYMGDKGREKRVKGRGSQALGCVLLAIGSGILLLGGLGVVWAAKNDQDFYIVMGAGGLLALVGALLLIKGIVSRWVHSHDA